MSTAPQEWVQRITEELYEQYPPATDAEVENGRRAFEAEFGIPLPVWYEQLWRASNGLGADGLSVYGTHDAVLDGDSQRPGIGESNERLLRGVHESDSPMRFVGAHNGVLLGYDTSDRRWKVVDEVSWTPDDEDRDSFDSFEAMLTPRLEMVVE